MESFLKTCTTIQLNFIDLYRLNGYSMLEWLDEIGFVDSDIKDVKELNDSMRDTYLDYLVKDGKGIMTEPKLERLRSY